MIEHSLCEEDGVVVDHHEDVVERLVGGLVLPVVESNGAEWADDLHEHGVLVAVLAGVNGHLVSVKEGKDTNESECRGQQVPHAVVHAGVEVEAGEAPDDKDCQLEQDDVAVIPRVEGDLLGPSD